MASNLVRTRSRSISRHVSERQPSEASRLVASALAIWSKYVWPVLAFILVFLLTPIWSPIVLILRGYQNWLINTVKHRNKEAIFMTPMDSLWFQESEENPCVINGAFWLDGHVDMITMKKFIMEKFIGTNEKGEIKYPKLRLIPKPIWHRMVWLPYDKFDVDEHVEHYSDDKLTTEKDLQDVIGKLASLPMRTDIPQWDAKFIDVDIDGEKQCLALIRFHHGIGDGVSITRMLTRELDQTIPIDKPPQEVRFAAKSHKILQFLATILTSPAQNWQLWRSSYDVHALHGPKLSGNKLVSWTPEFDLDLVKAMKNAAGMTINDIIMSCVASTFQTYFRRHASYIPAEITASIPVDFRVASGPDDMTLDNQFSLVFLDLPLDKKNRMATLRETHKRMNSIKRSTEPLVNAWTMKYTIERLPAWLSRWILNDMSDKCSMVLSNVPGTTGILTMNSQPIKKAVFWPPCRSTIGMAVSIHSYNGRMIMGMMVDKMIMSNPGLVTGMFLKEIHGLANDLGVPVPT